MADLTLGTRIARRLMHGLYAVLILTVSGVPGSDLPEATGLIPDKILHFFEYGLLGFLGGWAYHTDKKRIWILLLFGAIFAAFDEFWQSFVPLRESDPLDFLADVSGHVAGTLAAWFLIRRPD